MGADLTLLQKLGRFGLVALFVIAAIYAIFKGRREPSPIVFDTRPATQSSSSLPLLNTSSAPPIAEQIKAQDATSELVIHVVGAVKKPGLMKMSPGSRVDDAIKACGGSKADADLENINLAAKLLDGTQLKVPSKSAPEDVAKVAEPYKAGSDESYLAMAEGGASSSQPRSSSAGKRPSGPVSLNTASSSQLQALPGVGPSTAQKIIEYRHQHGGFSSVEELMAVKGIGPKKMQALRKWLKL